MIDFVEAFYIKCEKIQLQLFNLKYWNDLADVFNLKHWNYLVVDLKCDLFEWFRSVCST